MFSLQNIHIVQVQRHQEHLRVKFHDKINFNTQLMLVINKPTAEVRV
jgi:hypothetical protein